MLTQTAKESYTMTKYQQAKRIVREYFDAIENASHENVDEVLKAHTTEGYLWRGVYPFREQQGAQAAADIFLVH